MLLCGVFLAVVGVHAAANELNLSHNMFGEDFNAEQIVQILHTIPSHILGYIHSLFQSMQKLFLLYKNVQA
jgi:hypothetical protein